jgi:hypothetical protein
MKRGISIVVFCVLFLTLQGNASADEQSLNDQCRAKIRAQIKDRKPIMAIPASLARARQCSSGFTIE